MSYLLRAASILVMILVFGWMGCEVLEGPPSHPARITVDGAEDDWADLDPLHVDAENDVPADNVDLQRLWMAHDAQFVFLRMDVGRTISLQEGNRLTLYLDVDSDSTTGLAAQGLGADVTWTFGERAGRYVHTGDTTEFEHAALGLVSAPTVTDSIFEVALRRDAQLDGQPLFPSDTLRVALADRASSGNALPDSGGVAYRLTDASAVDPPPSIALARPDETDLRALSYNVEFDGLFEPETAPQFERILQALRPDLIGFQEIYDHGADTTQRVVTAMLPPGEGASWHAAKAGRDLIAVSRYPIRETYTIPGYEDYESAGFVIDAQDAVGSDLLFIVTHPPCCRGGTPPADARRQQVVDGIVAFIRDAKTEGGALDLEADAPIVIAGDMNFVGDNQQPHTLRTGEIVNTDTYGDPIAPDWDGSPLVDAAPPVTGWPMNFTWYDEGSSFAPGRLDYIYYTDSVLDAAHRYVLFTPGMTADAREAANLQERDAIRASDHLPVVVDFAARE